MGQRLLAVASERGEVRWELPLDKGLAGHAVRHNAILNVRKAYDDPRFFSASDSVMGTKSREVLCVPVTLELAALQPTSVFAVLQAWNTTTAKPFSPNDQIVAGLVASHAGAALLQTRATDAMQRVNRQVLEIVRLPTQLAPKALVPAAGAASSDASRVSLVHLVRAAQKKLAELIGINKLRIFVLDSDVLRIWHVGARLDAPTSGHAELVPIRKYANVQSSLCALVLEPVEQSDDEQDPLVACCRLLLDPTVEPTFNDTVDIAGGAHGLYLAPIRSPWPDAPPLGMIQVARTGRALTSLGQDATGLSTSAAIKDKLAAQRVEDELTMQLIALFADVFSGVLHHAMALQLHETTPIEVRDARLAYLSDRLDELEGEYLREQEEAEAEAAAAMARANARLEQTLKGAIPAEPVGLISTDSMYAIDMLGLGVDSASSSSPAVGATESATPGSGGVEAAGPADE
ncbi:hypothetical protein P43SY_001239 [Pythium insidiosum]|uniref:GAF domain-containing protein n=1 Tax=Pythium insidiosum TaxID=114742 RepID=A0AAD5LT12_PYTIN|nr:hypothetical protein P43SY_001239 [Pythium insidiosum]